MPPGKGNNNILINYLVISTLPSHQQRMEEEAEKLDHDPSQTNSIKRLLVFRNKLWRTEGSSPTPPAISNLHLPSSSTPSPLPPSQPSSSSAFDSCLFSRKEPFASAKESSRKTVISHPLQDVDDDEDYEAKLVPGEKPLIDTGGTSSTAGGVTTPVIDMIRSSSSTFLSRLMEQSNRFSGVSSTSGHERLDPSSNMSTFDGHPPTDSFNLIFFGLILAGIGFLLPYNSVVSAVDFYQDKFPGSVVVFDMSFVYIVIALVAVVVNNFLVESIPFSHRINLGYLLTLSMLIFITLTEVVFADWISDTVISYRLNLIGVSLLAFGATVQQSSFYGYASMLPAKYSQALMIGESAAGLVVSFNRIITKSLLPNDSRGNTILFFSVCILIISVCLVLHNVLHRRSRFIQFYLRLCSSSTESLAHSSRTATISGQSTGNGTLRTVASSSVDPYNSFQRTDYFHDPIESVSSSSNRSHWPKQSNQHQRNFAHSDSAEFDMPFGIDDEDLHNYTPPVLNTSSNKVKFHRKPSTSFDLEVFAEEEIDLNEDDHGRDDNGMTLRTQESHEDSVADPQITFGGLISPDNGLITGPSGRIPGSLDPKGLYRATRDFFASRLRRLSIRIENRLQSRSQVIQSIWPFMISIAVDYTVTLMLFPGIETEIVSCSLADWMPVLLMFTFNLTDFVGKIMAGVFQDMSASSMMTLSMSRIVFLPLLFLCVGPHRISPFFKTESWSFFFTSLFGVSNGVFGSLPMIVAPSRLPSHLKELTGNVMTISYSCGLTLGSLLAYVVESTLGPSLHPEQVISMCYSWSSTNDSMKCLNGTCSISNSNDAIIEQTQL